MLLQVFYFKAESQQIRMCSIVRQNVEVVPAYVAHDKILLLSTGFICDNSDHCVKRKKKQKLFLATATKCLYHDTAKMSKNKINK